MIHYSHAMTCLMAYHNKKGSEAISIVLQTTIYLILVTSHVRINGPAKMIVQICKQALEMSIELNDDSESPDDTF
jgi:hypothetical protein